LDLILDLIFLGAALGLTRPIEADVHAECVQRRSEMYNKRVPTYGELLFERHLGSQEIGFGRELSLHGIPPSEARDKYHSKN